MQFKTTAAFLIGGKWGWRTWIHGSANLHAAVVTMAYQLCATGYDTGNAEHAHISEAKTW